jgi:hypothetical protein
MDVLLELKSTTFVDVLVLNLIYNNYSIYLIKNNYLYCSKIYAHVSLIEKCIRNKFCHYEKFKFITI